MKSILSAMAMATICLAQNTVDGSMTVAGKKAKLSHVYAYAVPGFFDKTKDDTVVLLTDRELAPAQIRDSFGLNKLVEQGKLCYVQETINAAGQIVNFSLGHASFKFPPGGGSTEHVFEGKLTKTSINGKAFTKGEQKSFGVPYDYSVAINAATTPRK